MKKAVVITTWINYILSILLWILGILFLLFNILGKWTAWHLAGFGYFSFLFFPVNASGISILIAALSKDSKLRKKYIWRNIIALVISMAVTIFSYFVSCSWFW